jgi:CubicO group peptidase (beta-lactamase class C family)
MTRPAADIGREGFSSKAPLWSSVVVVKGHASLAAAGPRTRPEISQLRHPRRENLMEDWLERTAAYIPTWVDYQLRNQEQVGCLLAIVHEGELVLEYAAGSANLVTGERLTPRHRFRVMSHSAGLTRDGSAGNQFTGFRPFLDKAELLSDLAKRPVLDRNTRFKYSTTASPCSASS